MVSEIKELHTKYGNSMEIELIALINMVKRVSGKVDIKIFWHDNNEIYTDGKDVYIPKKYKRKFDISLGVGNHEAGHIGYGTFEIAEAGFEKKIAIKHDLTEAFVHRLLNAIEDVRINMINKNKFPGFHRRLVAFTFSYMDELREQIKTQQDIMVYINLFMEDYKDFQNKPAFEKWPISDEDWEDVIKIKTFLRRELTTGASIIALHLLAKILRKYIPKEELDKMKNMADFMGESKQLREALRRILKSTLEKSEIAKSNKKLIETLEKTEITAGDLEDLLGKEKEKKEDGKKGKGKGKDGKGEKGEGGKEKGEGDGESEGEGKGKGEGSDKGKSDTEKRLEQLRKYRKDPSTKPTKKSEGEETEEDDDDIPDEVTYADHGIKYGGSVLTNAEKKEILRKEEERRKRLAKIKPILKALEESKEVMEERLKTLERGTRRDLFDPSPLTGNHPVIEARIEKENMRPISLKLQKIRMRYRIPINRMKTYFSNIKTHSGIDHYQKSGRPNNKLVRGYISQGQFSRFYSKKIPNKELRVLILVDISGSMAGSSRLPAAKTALIMLCDALEGIAKFRIVLFTGRKSAINILVKDFDEPLEAKKADLFGCHSNYGGNLDGVSIKHEAKKLREKDLIIVISDGQPASSGYGLCNAIADIHDVRKKFKVFAFSLDANGDHLSKMYGKEGHDWLVVKSRDTTELGLKMVSFCRIVAKEYLR